MNNFSSDKSENKNRLGFPNYQVNDAASARVFEYVADRLIPALFPIESEACSIGDRVQPRCLSHWHYIEHLMICVECVSDGNANTRRGVTFHPQKAFLGHGCLPFQQVYVLTACTPSVATFCSGLEPYRWNRHCNDFSVYRGDVEPDQIDRQVLERLVTEEGVEVEQYLKDLESGYCGDDSFHEFQCRQCGEISYSLDYPL